jgi:hypothetical protein
VSPQAIRKEERQTNIRRLNNSLRRRSQIQATNIYDTNRSCQNNGRFGNEENSTDLSANGDHRQKGDAMDSIIRDKDRANEETKVQTQ